MPMMPQNKKAAAIAARIMGPAINSMTPKDMAMMKKQLKKETGSLVRS